MTVTYEEILQQMQLEFERLTGMEADQASDIGIRLKVLRHFHCPPLRETAKGWQLFPFPGAALP